MLGPEPCKLVRVIPGWATLLVMPHPKALLRRSNSSANSMRASLSGARHNQPAGANSSIVIIVVSDQRIQGPPIHGLGVPV